MIKKENRKVRFVLVVILLLSVLTACSSPEKAIIGKWQSADGTMEFFEDGIVVLDDSSSPGSYTIVDESHIQLGEGFNALLLEFEIAGDTLTLIDGNERIEFTRVN